MNWRSVIFIVILALPIVCNSAFAQDSLLIRADLSRIRQDDSLKALNLFHTAENFALTGQADSIFSNVRRSLEIASQVELPSIEAMNFELLGSVYDGMQNWDETLRNYIKAASIYNIINRSDKEAGIYRILAGKYYDMGIYRKASDYFELEFSLYSSGNENLMSKASEGAALALFYLPDDTLSAKWYRTAYQYYEKGSDSEGMTRCLQKLAYLNIRLEDYEMANEIYNRLLSQFAGRKDYPNEALTYYNLGYLKFRFKDFAGAIADFRLAAETSGKGGSDPVFLTDVFSNIAVCHQNLGQQQVMLDNFRMALGYAVDSKRDYEIARLNHLLSVIYFRKGDNYHAELYCLDCIEAAGKSTGDTILQECYKTYSEVLKNGNDFVKALEYYEKYLSLRDSLNYEIRLMEQKELDRQAAYEDLEQRIRLEIAQEEIQGLAIKTLRAESSQRENEIKLIQKERELERSENERQVQSFALEKERFVLSLREQEVMSLQERKRSDSLDLIVKQNEADALDRQNKTLEKEKQQQELDIRKQKQIKRLALGISVLMVLVAFMILAGLISIRRKNQKLAESKLEIEKINADLEIKNAEISMQKDIIEQKNQSITDSIQYASRIQTAVLPPDNFLTEWGFENFILFKPKDIVSGDFYWGKRKKEKVIVAAADCTGHGVPGAFMSMLGHAFLDEIINTTEAENAASILDTLRDEVINTLRQHGMTGETRDGMDISLCIIDKQNGSIEFAGANNPLYLIREGILIRIQADKMPIGIHVSTLTPFTNNRFDLKKGDSMYLFTDGYADQFGGPKGRKMMYGPFQELLLKNRMEPMNVQKEMLDDFFLKWKGELEQVDDVLIIGIKL